MYNILIHTSRLFLKAIGQFNTKIKKGVEGRKETFDKLKNHISKTDKTLWFHCASLGEYEQGLPVFNALKPLYPEHKIVLSFFSPSGYEVRKNTPIADVVVYLPLDTKANAKQFLDLVHPDLVIFVKYEIWPNLLREVKKRGIKSILISALFRDNQVFFKPYGKLMRQALFSFHHIFTQDESSKTLLESIGYNTVSVSGDTRFDRVSSQLEQNNKLDFMEAFKQDKLCVVAGSTWPEDELYFINYINSEDIENLKFVIAPHDIKPNQIEKLKSKLNKKTVLFSELNSKKPENYEVLILDTIGLLSKVYSYADVAYVGGAAGKTGLHNTLEPAVFGVPIIIGSNFDKFPEAKNMIEGQGMVSVKNQTEFNDALTLFLQNNSKRTTYGTNNFNYIKKNTGAVIQIIEYLRK